MKEVKLIMEPRIVKTEQQHRDAIAEVERLAVEDPPIGSAEGDRLELLAKLVEDYEKQRFAFARPDPLSAIRFAWRSRACVRKTLRRCWVEKTECRKYSPASVP